MRVYNLMNFFKEEVLNQGKLKQMIQTIRDRLFLIPGRLAATSRRWVLKGLATEAILSLPIPSGSSPG